MTSKEKYDFIIKNNRIMSHQLIAAALIIKVPMVRYYLYKYTHNPERKKNIIKRLPAIEIKQLKKILNINDYSTNGFWDSKKWSKCLPI